MGKTLTKRIWQLHSWLGLICGVGLLVIGVTGSLLVFHDEIDAWRFPALHHTQSSAAGRLPYDALWKSLRQAFPNEKITGWLPARAPDRTDAVYVTRPSEEDARVFYLDQYTGQVRDRPRRTARTFFGWLLELHFTLLGGTVGMFVAGLLAALLLVLGLSGVWLYRGFWRHFFTLRWGRSARLFFSDLHKMIGISSTGFNLILGFTGAWWNLNAVWSRWTAPATPATPPPAQVGGPFDFTADGLSLDGLMARAQTELPGYQAVYLALPPERTGTITFYGTVPTHNLLRGDFGSRLLFDAANGSLRQVVDIRRGSVWEKIGDSFALLHYGTFGAVFGSVVDAAVKILWTLLGLTPGVLAVTGFMIWRLRGRNRQQNARTLATAQNLRVG